MSKRNFTLVELLLVAAVLALMAALLPGLHADDAAKQASCADNMHKIGLNVQQYAADNDEFVPGLYQSVQNTANGQRWLFTMVKYSKDLRLFSCPDSPAFKKHSAEIPKCNPAKADVPPDLYTVNSAGSIGVNATYGLPSSTINFETSRKLSSVKNPEKVAYAADVTGSDTAIPEYAKGNSTGLYFGPRLAPAHAAIFTPHEEQANFLILNGTVRTLNRENLQGLIDTVNQRDSEGNRFFFAAK